MESSCKSKVIRDKTRQSRRAKRAALASTFVALCVVLGSGCSRLSGDHDAEEVDEQEVTMEQLMNESNDSPKPKRSTAANKPPVVSHQVVADDSAPKPAVAEPLPNAKSTARERAISAANSASTNPFTKARRAGLNKKSRVPTVDRSDEIPDAAEVGL
jgi:hypothetical protein